MNIDDYILSGSVESYVLGLADADEVREIESLISKHPELKKSVQNFELSLERSVLANAVTPSAAVKGRIMAALKNDFVASEHSINISSTSKIVPFDGNNIKSISPKGWVKYLAAASVILLVASAGLNIYFYSKYDEANSKVVALLNEKNILTASNQSTQVKYLDLYSNLQLMSNPDMIKVSMPGVKGKENNLATVFWDNKTKDVYLLANKLPEVPADKQYQLWALVDGKPVDAGMLTDCNAVCRLKNIPRAQTFAITLENVGGSPSPHLDQLYVLGNVRS